MMNNKYFLPLDELDAQGRTMAMDPIQVAAGEILDWMASYRLTSEQQPAFVESLLQNKNFLERVAEATHRKYTERIGKDVPMFDPQSAGEDAGLTKRALGIAQNLAGAFALEAGSHQVIEEKLHELTVEASVGQIRLETGTTESDGEILRRIVDGQLSAAEWEILERMANITWKTSQPYRMRPNTDFTNRIIGNKDFIAWDNLDRPTKEKDRVQIQAAAIVALTLFEAREFLKEPPARDRTRNRFQRLFKDPVFLILSALEANDAYNWGAKTDNDFYPPTKAEQEESSGLTVRDAAYAVNVSGVFSVLSAMRMILKRPQRQGQSLAQVLQDVRTGGDKLKDDERELLMRVAHLAWSAGKPFRIKKGEQLFEGMMNNKYFLPLEELDENGRTMAMDPIQVAAEKILEWMAPHNLTPEQQPAFMESLLQNKDFLKQVAEATHQKYTERIGKDIPMFDPQSAGEDSGLTKRALGIFQNLAGTMALQAALAQIRSETGTTEDDEAILRRIEDDQLKNSEWEILECMAHLAWMANQPYRMRPNTDFTDRIIGNKAFTIWNRPNDSNRDKDKVQIQTAAALVLLIFENETETQDQNDLNAIRIDGTAGNPFKEENLGWKETWRRFFQRRIYRENHGPFVMRYLSADQRAKAQERLKRLSEHLSMDAHLTEQKGKIWGYALALAQHAVDLTKKEEFNTAFIPFGNSLWDAKVWSRPNGRMSTMLEVERPLKIQEWQIILAAERPANSELRSDMNDSIETGFGAERPIDPLEHFKKNNILPTIYLLQHKKFTNGKWMRPSSISAEGIQSFVRLNTFAQKIADVAIFGPNFKSDKNDQLQYPVTAEVSNDEFQKMTDEIERLFFEFSPDTPKSPELPPLRTINLTVQPDQGPYQGQTLNLKMVEKRSYHRKLQSVESAFVLEIEGPGIKITAKLTAWDQEEQFVNAKEELEKFKKLLLQGMSVNFCEWFFHEQNIPSFFPAFIPPDGVFHVDLNDQGRPIVKLEKTIPGGERTQIVVTPLLPQYPDDFEFATTSQYPGKPHLYKGESGRLITDPKVIIQLRKAFAMAQQAMKAKKEKPAALAADIMRKFLGDRTAERWSFLVELPLTMADFIWWATGLSRLMPETIRNWFLNMHTRGGPEARARGLHQIRVSTAATFVGSFLGISFYQYFFGSLPSSDFLSLLIFISRVVAISLIPSAIVNAAVHLNHNLNNPGDSALSVMRLNPGEEDELERAKRFMNYVQKLGKTPETFIRFLNFWARDHQFSFVFEEDPMNQNSRKLFEVFGGNQDALTTLLVESARINSRLRKITDDLTTQINDQGIHFSTPRIAFTYDETGTFMDSMHTMSAEPNRDRGEKARYLLLDHPPQQSELDADSPQAFHVLRVNLAPVIKPGQTNIEIPDFETLKMDVAHEIGHALFAGPLVDKIAFGSMLKGNLVDPLQKGLEHPYFSGLHFDFRSYGYNFSPRSIEGVEWIIALLEETHAWWVADQLTHDPTVPGHPELEKALERLAGVYLGEINSNSNRSTDYLTRALVLLSFEKEYGLRGKNIEEVEGRVRKSPSLSRYMEQLVDNGGAGSLRGFIQGLKFSAQEEELSENALLDPLALNASDTFLEVSVHNQGAYARAAARFVKQSCAVVFDDLSVQRSPLDDPITQLRHPSDIRPESVSKALMVAWLESGDVFRSLKKFTKDNETHTGLVHYVPLQFSRESQTLPLAFDEPLPGWHMKILQQNTAAGGILFRWVKTGKTETPGHGPEYAGGSINSSEMDSSADPQEIKIRLTNTSQLQDEEIKMELPKPEQSPDYEGQEIMIKIGHEARELIYVAASNLEGELKWHLFEVQLERQPTLMEQRLQDLQLEEMELIRRGVDPEFLAHKRGQMGLRGTMVWAWKFFKLAAPTVSFSDYQRNHAGWFENGLAYIFVSIVVLTVGITAGHWLDQNFLANTSTWMRAYQAAWGLFVLFHVVDLVLNRFRKNTETGPPGERAKLSYLASSIVIAAINIVIPLALTWFFPSLNDSHALLTLSVATSFGVHWAFNRIFLTRGQVSSIQSPENTSPAKLRTEDGSAEAAEYSRWQEVWREESAERKQWETEEVGVIDDMMGPLSGVLPMEIVREQDLLKKAGRSAIWFEREDPKAKDAVKSRTDMGAQTVAQLARQIERLKVMSAPIFSNLVPREIRDRVASLKNPMNADFLMLLDERGIVRGYLSGVTIGNIYKIEEVFGQNGPGQHETEFPAGRHISNRPMQRMQGVGSDLLRIALQEVTQRPDIETVSWDAWPGAVSFYLKFLNELGIPRSSYKVKPTEPQKPDDNQTFSIPIEKVREAFNRRNNEVGAGTLCSHFLRLYGAQIKNENWNEKKIQDAWETYKGQAWRLENWHFLLTTWKDWPSRGIAVLYVLIVGALFGTTGFDADTLLTALKLFAVAFSAVNMRMWQRFVRDHVNDQRGDRAPPELEKNVRAAKVIAEWNKFVGALPLFFVFFPASFGITYFSLTLLGALVTVIVFGFEIHRRVNLAGKDSPEFNDQPSPAAAFLMLFKNPERSLDLVELIADLSPEEKLECLAALTDYLDANFLGFLRGETPVAEAPPSQIFRTMKTLAELIESETSAHHLSYAMAYLVFRARAMINAARSGDAKRVAALRENMEGTRGSMRWINAIFENAGLPWQLLQQNGHYRFLKEGPFTPPIVKDEAPLIRPHYREIAKAEANQFISSYEYHDGAFAALEVEAAKGRKVVVVNVDPHRDTYTFKNMGDDGKIVQDNNWAIRALTYENKLTGAKLTDTVVQMILPPAGQENSSPRYMVYYLAKNGRLKSRQVENAAALQEFFKDSSVLLTVDADSFSLEPDEEWDEGNSAFDPRMRLGYHYDPKGKGDAPARFAARLQLVKDFMATLNISPTKVVIAESPEYLNKKGVNESSGYTTPLSGLPADPVDETPGSLWFKNIEAEIINTFTPSLPGRGIFYRPSWAAHGGWMQASWDFGIGPVVNFVATRIWRPDKSDVSDPLLDDIERKFFDPQSDFRAQIKSFLSQDPAFWNAVEKDPKELTKKLERWDGFLSPALMPMLESRLVANQPLNHLWYVNLDNFTGSFLHRLIPEALASSNPQERLVEMIEELSYFANVSALMWVAQADLIATNQASKAKGAAVILKLDELLRSASAEVMSGQLTNNILLIAPGAWETRILTMSPAVFNQHWYWPKEKLNFPFLRQTIADRVQLQPGYEEDQEGVPIVPMEKQLLELDRASEYWPAGNKSRLRALDVLSVINHLESQIEIEHEKNIGQAIDKIIYNNEQDIETLVRHFEPLLASAIAGDKDSLYALGRLALFGPRAVLDPTFVNQYRNFSFIRSNRISMTQRKQAVAQALKVVSEQGPILELSPGSLFTYQFVITALKGLYRGIAPVITISDFHFKTERWKNWAQKIGVDANTVFQALAGSSKAALDPKYLRAFELSRLNPLLEKNGIASPWTSEQGGRLAPTTVPPAAILALADRRSLLRNEQRLWLLFNVAGIKQFDMGASREIEIGYSILETINNALDITMERERCSREEAAQRIQVTVSYDALRGLVIRIKNSGAMEKISDEQLKAHAEILEAMRYFVRKPGEPHPATDSPAYKRSKKMVLKHAGAKWSQMSKFQNVQLDVTSDKLPLLYKYRDELEKTRQDILEMLKTKEPGGRQFPPKLFFSSKTKEFINAYFRVDDQSIFSPPYGFKEPMGRRAGIGVAMAAYYGRTSEFDVSLHSTADATIATIHIPRKHLESINSERGKYTMAYIDDLKERLGRLASGANNHNKAAVMLYFTIYNAIKTFPVSEKRINAEIANYLEKMRTQKILVVTDESDSALRNLMVNELGFSSENISVIKPSMNAFPTGLNGFQWCFIASENIDAYTIAPMIAPALDNQRRLVFLTDEGVVGMADTSSIERAFERAGLTKIEHNYPIDSDWLPDSSHTISIFEKRENGQDLLRHQTLSFFPDSKNYTLRISWWLETLGVAIAIVLFAHAHGFPTNVDALFIQSAFGAMYASTFPLLVGGLEATLLFVASHYAIDMVRFLFTGRKILRDHLALNLKAILGAFFASFISLIGVLDVEVMNATGVHFPIFT